MVRIRLIKPKKLWVGLRLAGRVSGGIFGPPPKDEKSHYKRHQPSFGGIASMIIVLTIP